jgi:hypothetical protein
MKGVLHTVVGLVLVLLAGPAASAQPERTVEMLLACRPLLKAEASGEVRLPSSNTFKFGQCWGAFEVLDDITRLGGRDQQRLFEICAPAEATHWASIAAFVKFAENNRKRWHEDFVTVALDALREAYPCSTAPAPPPRK